MLNLIIDNISYLSEPQLNTAVASVIYKAKNRKLTHHKSYRLVRVTPMVGRLIDEHIRPTMVKVVKPIQNQSQYGFTENISYLMGALQRHECEKFCLDMKKIFLVARSMETELLRLLTELFKHVNYILVASKVIIGRQVIIHFKIPKLRLR